MVTSDLKSKLLQLSGLNRPTENVTENGVTVQKEVWTEENTATTIKEIMDDNDRLERELKEAKDRYITDFLSSGTTGDSGNINTPEPKKQIKPEDFLNI